MGKRTKFTGVRASRNKAISGGVNAKGRCRAASKSGKYLHLKKGGKPAVAKAAVETKEPRWYAADNVKIPIPSRKSRHKPTKLRKTITPGSVLILLAGRFKGKRVVFLKQLDSGLLMVTGPYKVNGVPIRRVNQAYVIATSTKVDVSKVKVDSIDDAFFARAKKEKRKEGGEFLEEEDKKGEVSQERKDMQKQVDSALLKALGKDTLLKSYLNARFTLTNGVAPHTLKF